MPGSTQHSPARAEPPATRRAFAWLLTVPGGVGLLAAAALLVKKKLALPRSPAHVPSCSINPVLGCGSIMSAPQADAFGFPNPLLGVVGFTVVTTVGAALLAGGRPARWFWVGLQVGTTAGLAFVHWLIAQSLCRIGALCPYRIAVWVVTITLFVSVTARNITQGDPDAGRGHADHALHVHRPAAGVTHLGSEHRAEV